MIRFKHLSPVLAKDLLVAFEPNLVQHEFLETQSREDMVAWICYGLKVSSERLLPKEEYPQVAFYDDFVSIATARYNLLGKLMQVQPRTISDCVTVVFGSSTSHMSPATLRLPTSRLGSIQ